MGVELLPGLFIVAVSVDDILDVPSMSYSGLLDHERRGPFKGPLVKAVVLTPTTTLRIRPIL